MLIEETLSALSNVHSVTQGLLAVLARNPRNVVKANAATSVFQGYEQRLFALNVEPGGTGLSNRQRDLLRSILKARRVP